MKGDGGGGKVESNGGCDEDGSVLETQQVGKRQRFEMDKELIEEAVLAVRNER
ncbi:hypothetical protein U1Q18_001895, partial [Sarracenia purpurea var. burkii]